jgi:peroxiredoxin (alkyl hydroperoxide reductase subunit C)
MMLQKNLTAYYADPEVKPTLVHPDGSEEPLSLSSSTYRCFLVFQAAYEPLASAELVAFSEAAAEFAALDCSVIGLARDSVHVLRDWLQELGEAATVPCASCPHLGRENCGLIQALGVPLVLGYPLPAIVITDLAGRVRHHATFRPGTARSAEETLRVVAAVREVDSARGGLYTPADWAPGEPAVPSTGPGVEAFYRARHGEEEGPGEGRVAALRARLHQFYQGVFGAGSTADGEDKERIEGAVNTIVDKAIESQDSKADPAEVRKEVEEKMGAYANRHKYAKK